MRIAAEHLTIKYDQQAALEDVSFDIHGGDYFCILGENGSGKSTLLKALLGLVTPQNGTIRYEGVSKKQLGYLPQQTQVQRDFPASVREVVLSGTLGPGLRPFYSRAQKAAAEEHMRKLDILDLQYKSFQQLSGGQRQRVLLARALSSAETVLLLDEPATGLDPLITAEFYAIIEKLNREDGMTVITVTHDVDSALRYGSKILHLDKTVLFFGPKEQYLHSKICRLYLGGDCQC